MKIAKYLLIFFTISAILTACIPAGSEQVVNTEYILTTGIRDGKFVFVGVNGDINGLANPALHAIPGERIKVMLVNSGDGKHDIVFPDLDVHSNVLSKQGQTVSVTFTVPETDTTLPYYDTTHEAIGMQGILVVGNGSATGNAAMQQSTPTVTASEPTSTVETVPQPGTTVEYALESGLNDGKMVFIGKGGDIDGKINPDLTANVGDQVKITLFSGEGAQHNITVPEFNAQSADVTGKGNSVLLEFTPDHTGTFPYYCAIPGHRQAGMEGKFIVGAGAASTAETGATEPAGAAAVAPLVSPLVTPMVTPTSVTPGQAAANAVDIVRDPTDLPASIGSRGPQTVRVDLEAVEVIGNLADGTTYHYWTFGGKVPGPFLRVRVGDTVEVHLKNDASSTMMHSVDFHAVTGPGGGAVATQTQPGGETMFTFKALNPGLYVYHCATPMVAQHISNGMYGLILVEPEGGLPPVDREFYVMQGEIYTNEPFGTPGDLTGDVTRLLNEDPEYFVLNGASMALTSDVHALHAKTGETIRIFFGVGGPNFTSSFHIIGEIFDRVYDQASLTASPLTNVQTTIVPPGGATMVELQLQVPGRYILVDHALSRMERGLAGFLYVEGDAVPEIFNATITSGSGH